MKALLFRPKISKTSLCNNVLGSKTVCGIYKITNKNNGLCYVGQSVDIADRWKQHIKCGLGIDTPAQNKLYKAMLKDGVTNFTFELLEQCDRQLLNEKENSRSFVNFSCHNRVADLLHGLIYAHSDVRFITENALDVRIKLAVALVEYCIPGLVVRV